MNSNVKIHIWVGFTGLEKKHPISVSGFEISTCIFGGLLSVTKLTSRRNMTKSEIAKGPLSNPSSELLNLEKTHMGLVSIYLFFFVHCMS